MESRCIGKVSSFCMAHDRFGRNSLQSCRAFKTYVHYKYLFVLSTFFKEVGLCIRGASGETGRLSSVDPQCISTYLKASLLAGGLLHDMLSLMVQSDSGAEVQHHGRYVHSSIMVSLFTTSRKRLMSTIIIWRLEGQGQRQKIVAKAALNWSFCCRHVEQKRRSVEREIGICGGGVWCQFWVNFYTKHKDCLQAPDQCLSNCPCDKYNFILRAGLSAIHISLTYTCSITFAIYVLDKHWKPQGVRTKPWNSLYQALHWCLHCLCVGHQRMHSKPHLTIDWLLLLLI